MPGWTLRDGASTEVGKSRGPNHCQPEVPTQSTSKLVTKSAKLEKKLSRKCDYAHNKIVPILRQLLSTPRKPTAVKYQIISRSISAAPTSREWGHMTSLVSRSQQPRARQLFFFYFHKHIERFQLLFEDERIIWENKSTLNPQGNRQSYMFKQPLWLVAEVKRVLPSSLRRSSWS